MGRSRLLLLGLLAATAPGCLHGPRAFSASHALHNEALRTRIDEELLLNLVRLRYRDSPLFLQVGSVVTQFELAGSLGAGASLQESGPDSLGLDAGVGWSEQPTYTFTPLQDDEFVRRLLTPIDLELVMLMQRSGWSIERLMRLTVLSFGGLDNAPSASGPTPTRAPDFEDFLRLTKLLRGLQREGLLQLAYEKRSSDVSAPVESSSVLGADLLEAVESGLRFEPVEGSATRLVLRQSEKKPVLLMSPSIRDDPEALELASLLGLPPGRTRYELAVGTWSKTIDAAEADSVIGVSMRSLLGAFFYLSHGIDVPAAHVEQGLVTVTCDPAGEAFDWRRLTGDVLRVKTSPGRPAAAAIAVPYRGHWFYIEDSDLESKSTFALLLEIFNMSADASSAVAPALTLQVGG